MAAVTQLPKLRTRSAVFWCWRLLPPGTEQLERTIEQSHRGIERSKSTREQSDRGMEKSQSTVGQPESTIEQSIEQPESGKEQSE